MRIFINGQEHEISTNRDGTIDSEILRSRGCIPKNRALVVTKRNGANEIINPGQKVRVNPGEHFGDLSLHKRGIWPCVHHAYQVI